VEKSLPSRFNHIRSIKNVFDVQFSLNRKYDPSHQVQVGKEAANLDSPYECLITGRPINGQYAFSAIKTCGHVFSEKGLQQSKSQTLACIICQKSYTLDDIVQLNPDKPTQEALKLKLQQSNKEKKSHKHHKGIPTEQDQPKQQKEEKHPKSDLNTNEDQKTEKRKSSQLESKRPAKKQKVSSPSSTTTGPTAGNVLAVKDALSKVRNNHDAKKRASDAYKSIFSSNHPSAPAYLTGIPRAVIK